MTPEQIAAARALVDAATPGNKWRAAGLPDPHGTRYDCPRSELPMADLSDDELANGVYLYGDSQPPIADLLSGKAKTSGVWLDAAKNRIRWLSRRLDALNDMTARAEAAEARAADLTAKLEAMQEVETWQIKQRADVMARRYMNAPEDPQVRAICERYGYGAVMDAASRLWARKDSLGAFYIGGCVGFRSDDEARAALKAGGAA